MKYSCNRASHKLRFSLFVRFFMPKDGGCMHVPEVVCFFVFHIASITTVFLNTFIHVLYLQLTCVETNPYCRQYRNCFFCFRTGHPICLRSLGGEVCTCTVMSLICRPMPWWDELYGILCHIKLTLRTYSVKDCKILLKSILDSSIL